MMDVLSETFLLAFSPRQRDAFSPSVKYFTYLVGIARNVTRTRIRQDARMQHGEVPEATAAGPEQRHEAKELIEQILAPLSERERSAVMMTLLERRTQESAARHLGVDRNWVKRAVQRARTRLVEMTAGRGPNEED